MAEKDRFTSMFLRLALRRAARGSGYLKDFHNRRTSVQPIPDLTPILSPLRWALIGGIALRAYAPERMTLDVDILIHDRDASAAREAFVDTEYEIVGELGIGGFTARPPTPNVWPVVVCTRDDP